jgi:hypothetical protein
MGQNFRVSSNDHLGGKGTGLGLALVRQIVKLSGGRLGVQSRLGQGSMFWVELRESVYLASILPFNLCHSFGCGIHNNGTLRPSGAIFQ